MAAFTFVLSVVLAVAGALKWSQWINPIPSASTGPATWLDPVIAAGNVCLAVWLVSGIHPRTARMVATLSFSAFAVFSFVSALDGSTSCGCFGRVAVSPWGTLSFNVAAIVGLLVIRQLESREVAAFESPTSGARKVALLILASCAVIGVDAYLTTSTAKAVLDPLQSAGKPFPLLNAIDIGARISTGSWRLLLVRPGCVDCKEAMAKVGDSTDLRSRHEERIPLAIISLVAPGRTADAIAIDCLQGKMVDNSALFIATPMEIHIVDGIIQAPGS